MDIVRYVIPGNCYLHIMFCVPGKLFLCLYPLTTQVISKPPAQWTAEGLRFSKSDEYVSKTVAAKPGLHFQAIPCPRNTSFLFPEEPQHIFSTYRHTWALQRKARPDVALIEKCKLPHPSRLNNYNGQYYNLFFRPWTLLPGEVTVPNLTLPGLDKAD